ncbi:hypothetical protein P5G65_20965 [Paenibacillus chondroitinus]|uniref:Uncharacterized protein n=1 Tax=Paenibacillus chondroitinus TaxID=59842 RepID=A0ABU6DFU4_9BACL|nr:MULTISPECIES: hypothetical protein [Paenibacillus]MEB4796381.1 hypothetical protein [Paenibacillus chondroitinus]
MKSASVDRRNCPLDEPSALSTIGSKPGIVMEDVWNDSAYAGSG